MRLLTPYAARRLARPGIATPYSVIPPFVSTGGVQAYGAFGYYEFAVPAGKSVFRAKTWGAAGGAGYGGTAGGGGAFAQADFAVAAGDTILCTVGAGGLEAALAHGDYSASKARFTGAPGGLDSGQARHGAWGGGLTMVARKDVQGNITVLLVAGAGGGAGSSPRPGVGLSGGTRDGSQSAGGTADGGYSASSGSWLRGGAGDPGPGTNDAGSGGGAGWFGGAGGRRNSVSPTEADGGGGSSWANPAQTANAVMTSGSGSSPANSGDADYSGSAGLGASGADGNPGRIVLLY